MVGEEDAVELCPFNEILFFVVMRHERNSLVGFPIVIVLYTIPYSHFSCPRKYSMDNLPYIAFDLRRVKKRNYA